MIIKLSENHQILDSLTCGELREILTADEYPSLSIAILFSTKSTKVHYHEGFDEIYFVLDGTILLKLYQPNTEAISTVELNSNELCVIRKGIHHGITEASDINRFCVLCVPGFNPQDETPSDKI